MVEPHPQLAYSTYGDAARPALLLVHGFMSCKAQWLPNLEQLSKHYYLVMAELWGHGDSPTPELAEYYSVSTYAAQFERIRKQLNITHWAVIGQSYGAGVVINYALSHPETCSAVIVTNSRSAFGRVGEPPTAAQSDRTADQAPFNPRQLPFHPVHARRFPADVQAELVRQADQITARAIAMGGLLTTDLQAQELIRQLTQPLLIVNGQYEKSFQRDLQKLRARYPDLQIADLEGGHSVNIEAAAGFNAVVHQFLNGLEPC